MDTDDAEQDRAYWDSVMQSNIEQIEALKSENVLIARGLATQSYMKPEDYKKRWEHLKSVVSKRVKARIAFIPTLNSKGFDINQCTFRVDHRIGGCHGSDELFGWFLELPVDDDGNIRSFEIRDLHCGGLFGTYQTDVPFLRYLSKHEYIKIRKFYNCI